MRWLVILALLGGCHIADTHFVGLGGDDAANGDGHATDASGDATLTNKRAYLVDSQSGIFVLARTTNGDLQFTATSYPGAGILSAVIDHAGKHLYVVISNPPTIRDFAIQSDGSLMTFAPDISVNCNPAKATVSPNDMFLAVGCTTPQIATFRVDPQLGLSGGTYTSVSTATATTTLAFNATSTCLFALDTSAAFNQPQNVHPFSIDPLTGNLVARPAVSGPTVVRALAVDPGGQYLYVAGAGQLFYFTIGGNCPLAGSGNTAASSMPNAVVFGPQGTAAYVLGNEVYAFSVSLGIPAAVPGSPFLTNSPQLLAGTVDPALPGVLYLTSPGFSGVVKTTIDPNTGAITGSTPTSSPQTTHAFGLQLGP